MDAFTQAALRRINRNFYSRHAADFDRTRHPGGWPGWQRVVETAAPATDRPLRVLDLGCGNGRFALFLQHNPELLSDRRFTYQGIDLSSELIDHARAAAAGLDHIRFEANDIENCTLAEATYDLVTLFGVLHHIPGFDMRRRTLERAASAVAPGGLLALTCWQFADDPGFERRRLDWASEAGVDPAELEPGDHLLRWGPADTEGRRQSRRRSSRRLRRQRVGRPAHQARRYCHHAGEPELDRLVEGFPLTEVARYRSDGPGGRQNLYWLGARDGAATLS
ncbi:MAG: class I SAM-dependent methyltransferase [Holophagales bacterium]|nr:class I SAM-dependent methyltransferase [Holophagales bacterium]MYD21090.1 class I SAM-dependent methyltransferase [Holophagales bacterium]MYI33150.1 class I SAM-dependent methyltransferase [Holophagales bacterium]